MRTATSSFALAIALAAPAAHAYDNEPKGFRGIEWGAPVASAPGLSPFGDPRGTSQGYRRAGDKLAIGGAHLVAIVYTFDHDRFEAAWVKLAPGAENAKAMIAALREQFGAGARPSSGDALLTWSGDVTHISVYCKSPAEGCTALFSSTAAMLEHAREREARDRAAAKAAKDDF